MMLPWLEMPPFLVPASAHFQGPSPLRELPQQAQSTPPRTLIPMG